MNAATKKLNNDLVLDKIKQLYKRHPTEFDIPYRDVLEKSCFDDRRDVTVLLETIWGSHEITADMFGEKWREFEPLLFRSSPLYRSHYDHQLSVFLLGYYMLNATILQNKKRAGLIRDADKYDSQELNFIWLLASTFHDVGYPVQMIHDVEGYLREFFKSFGVESVSIEALRHELLTPSSDMYARQIASVYTSLTSESFDPRALPPIPEGSTDWYVYKYLQSRLQDRDHGAVGAVVLLNSVLSDRQRKLDPYEYKCYLADSYPHVCRAALAIAMHNLRREDKIHIDCATDLISFLLLYCDEIQEWERASASPVEASLEDLDAKMLDTVLTFDLRLNLKGEGLHELAGRKRERLRTLLRRTDNLDFRTAIWSDNQLLAECPIPIDK